MLAPIWHTPRALALFRTREGSRPFLIRYVYPSYGSVEFVELPFRNPYGAEHCFTVVWDDPLGEVSRDLP